jgi:hypothetical protein
MLVRIPEASLSVSDFRHRVDTRVGAYSIGLGSGNLLLGTTESSSNLSNRASGMLGYIVNDLLASGHVCP